MQDLFTRDDYDRLPEGYPAQLVDGCLVREPGPTYRHQRVQSRLYARLVRLLDPDLVLAAPADVVLGEHDVYQPDLVVLRARPAPESRDVGIPVLAIEVLSETTADRDRHVKAPHLVDAGVAEVWLVDPTAARIETRTREGTRSATGDVPAVSQVVDGFQVIPRELFR